ncbi:MAG: Gar1/Naf1 family protein [Candidatus Bathyarchaeia archaeon]
MKELGKIIHVSRSGLLILRSNQAPKIGQKLHDGSSKIIGVVVDVFGPVSSPYISIKPWIKRPENRVGSAVYD